MSRSILAYAIYSDFSNAEAGRGVYSWIGGKDTSTAAAQVVKGSLIPSGISILYDSGRLVIARASVTIHDGKYNEDFAKVTLTLVFDKVSKQAIVYKDVKILLDTKVLDAITDFAFTERYELDLARVVNPSNEAFIHYYGIKSGGVTGALVDETNTTVYMHPETGQTTFDSIQAYDVNHQFIYFSGIWPSATDYSVYGNLVPGPQHQLHRHPNRCWW